VILLFISSLASFTKLQSLLPRPLHEHHVREHTMAVRIRTAGQESERIAVDTAAFADAPGGATPRESMPAAVQQVMVRAPTSYMEYSLMYHELPWSW
jgi:hypothetical protein